MATYRNGIETREALYSSARRNFAAQGYFDTSIKDIVTNVNSKLGLFTYYFDSKEALALEVLYELQEAVRKKTISTPAVSALADDALALNMACTRIWLGVIAQYPHVNRFAREIVVTDAYLAHAVSACRALWQQLHPDEDESNADKINYTLMAGMLGQFAHDLVQLELEDSLDDSIDHVFAAVYAPIASDGADLMAAIAASRKAAGQVRFCVNEDFLVTES